MTGVSRGLGLAIARRLVADGAIVSGVSRHLSPEFETFQSSCPERVRFRSADLSEVEGAAAAVFGDFLPLGLRLDGFVNNAAEAYSDLVTNLGVAPLDRMFRINVLAPMLLTRHVLRNMLLHRTAGAIVHVSSVSAHTGYSGLAMYAATKGALEAFSRGTAREWGRRGIRSNCVVPGFMETDMNATLPPEQRERIHERTSLKRATDAASVAATVAFLLGDGASSITGQTVHVDAGTL